MNVCVYHSRSGIGDLSSVNLPLRSGALDFHIRSFKGLLHNRQGIAAHCRGLYIFPGRQYRQWDKEQSRALATVNPDMLSVDRCLSSCMQFTVIMQKPLCYLYISHIHNTAAQRGKLFRAFHCKDVGPLRGFCLWCQERKQNLLLPHLHLHPQITRWYSPLQAKDAVEECVLSRTAVHDEDAAQYVEVKVVLVQVAEQPGLEEGCPSFLES